MPVAKSAYLRYRIINSCLSSKQKIYWTISELIERLNDHDIIIGRRTIETDFENMRHDERLGYSAPIKYCKKNKGFHYTDPNYSIDAIPLDDGDYRALKFAADILQQYTAVPLVKQFEGAIDKVVKVVKQLKSEQESPSRVISFEKAPYYKGLEFFERVHKGITDKQPLKITYRKFLSDNDNVHNFHPYLLKEYKGRWYVIGYGKERHFTFALGLERIASIEDAAIPFRPNKTVNLENYFEHILGITLGKGPVEDIRLWFSPAQAPYIKTRHIHNSLKIVSDEADGLVISLALIPNYELMQEILTYGPEVKVLEPVSLKEKIKEMLRKALERYE